MVSRSSNLLFFSFSPVSYFNGAMPSPSLTFVCFWCSPFRVLPPFIYPLSTAALFMENDRELLSIARLSVRSNFR
jgi:hypothetical protein